MFQVQIGQATNILTHSFATLWGRMGGQRYQIRRAQLQLLSQMNAQNWTYRSLCYLANFAHNPSGLPKGYILATLDEFTRSHGGQFIHPECWQCISHTVTSIDHNNQSNQVVLYAAHIGKHVSNANSHFVASENSQFKCPRPSNCVVYAAQLNQILRTCKSLDSWPLEKFCRIISSFPVVFILVYVVVLIVPASAGRDLRHVCPLFTKIWNDKTTQMEWQSKSKKCLSIVKQALFAISSVRGIRNLDSHSGRTGRNGR